MKPKVKGVVDLKELIASLQQNPNFKVSPELQAVLDQDAQLKPAKTAPPQRGRVAQHLEAGKPVAGPPSAPQGTVVAQKTRVTPKKEEPKTYSGRYANLPADAYGGRNKPATAANKAPSKTAPATGTGRLARGFLKGLLGKKGYSILDDIRDEIHVLSTQIVRMEKKQDSSEKREQTKASKLLTAVKGLLRGALGHKAFNAMAYSFGKRESKPATAEKVSHVESNKQLENVQRVPLANVPKAVDDVKAQLSQETPSPDPKAVAEGRDPQTQDQQMAAREKVEEKHDKETKGTQAKLDAIKEELDAIKKKATGGGSALLMGLLAIIGKVWKWLRGTLWKRLVQLGEWLGKKLWGALGSLMRAIRNIKLPSVAGAARAAVGALGSLAVNAAAVIGWDAGEKEMNRSQHTRKMTPLFEKYGLKELGNGKFELDGKKYKRVGEPGEEDSLPPALENLVTVATEDPRGGRAKNAQQYLTQHKDELDALEAAHQKYLSDHPEEAKAQNKVLLAKKQEDSKTFGSDVKQDINAAGSVVGVTPFGDDARYQAQQDSDNPFAGDVDNDSDLDINKMSAADITNLSRPDSATPQKLQQASSDNQQMKEADDVQTIVVTAPASRTPAQAAPAQIPAKPSNPVIITTRNPESTIQRLNSLLFDDPSGYTSLYRN